MLVRVLCSSHATVGHAPGSLTCDDQIGRSDSVEQAHCTLGAVKRCRALSEGGGLPNFWFTPLLKVLQTQHEKDRVARLRSISRLGLVRTSDP